MKEMERSKAKNRRNKEMGRLKEDEEEKNEKRRESMKREEIA